MSELVNTQHEKKESLISAPERHQALPPPELAEKLRKGEKDPVLALREARTDVQEITRSDKQPDPLERLQTAERAAKPAPVLNVSRELKSITLRRELQDIRRQLPGPQRLLSRVIHQPAIRAISEISAKSVSRPSGLLGGGLVAFLGTSGYLYLTRHLGFTYNYLIFLLLFVGGFGIGLALELLVYAATASRRHLNDQ
jgi:hypothetical protein